MRDNMTTHAPKKFIFETEFTADTDHAVSAPRQQRLFTRQDVEKIRQECFEKGQTTALVRAQELIVQAQDALAVPAAQVYAARTPLRTLGAVDCARTGHRRQER
jgi:hypothetical protein